MTKSAYRDEIKLRLTGGLLELEISDENLDKLIDAGLREIQRYICTTSIKTIPYSKCIDTSNMKINSVVGVYRPFGYATSQEQATTSDPMYVAQWQLLSGTGSLYNYSDYVSNYLAYNTMLQTRNTMSTDLSYRYDKSSEKLYVNVASNFPDLITIEYVPRYDSVEEITSDYWIDVLLRLCVAMAKVAVGRIRTRFVQPGSLLQDDGSTILSEGKNDLDALRQELAKNTQLVYGID